MGGQASVSAVADALDAVVTRRGFHHVDTWIFDLDNTLYPASCNLFAEVTSAWAHTSPRRSAFPLSTRVICRRPTIGNSARRSPD